MFKPADVVLDPVRNLLDRIHKLIRVVSVRQVGRVAPSRHPAVRHVEQPPMFFILPKAVHGVGQSQQEFQLMREDGCLGGECPPPLQFFVKLTQVAAIEHAHELRLQKALNCITRQVHGAAPAGRIQENTCVVHAVSARLFLAR
jgi:hypothetical protein